MDRYLGGEQIDEKLLIDDLETAIARGGFFPVTPVCAQSGTGLPELLDLACARSRRHPNTSHPTSSLPKEEQRPRSPATRRVPSSPRW